MGEYCYGGTATGTQQTDGNMAHVAFTYSGTGSSGFIIHYSYVPTGQYDNSDHCQINRDWGCHDTDLAVTDDISSAACDDKLGIMTTLNSQCF